MIIEIDNLNEAYFIAKQRIEMFDFENLSKCLLYNTGNDAYRQLMDFDMPIERAVDLLIVEFARFFVMKIVIKDYDASSLMPSFLIRWAWYQLTLLARDYSDLCQQMIGSGTSVQLFFNQDFCEIGDYHRKFDKVRFIILQPPILFHQLMFTIELTYYRL